MAENKKVELSEEERLKLTKSINDLFGKANLDKVTAESTGYEELPDGYFLCELTSARIRTSSKGNPMAECKFKVVEEGLVESVNADGDVELEDSKGCKNKPFTKYYVFSDEASVKRFVTDMLKFEEGDKRGTPAVGKEYFVNMEMIDMAIQILQGLRIYVQVSRSTKDGNTSVWYNLVSWKRADELHLA